MKCSNKLRKRCWQCLVAICVAVLCFNFPASAATSLSGLTDTNIEVSYENTNGWTLSGDTIDGTFSAQYYSETTSTLYIECSQDATISFDYTITAVGGSGKQTSTVTLTAGDYTKTATSTGTATKAGSQASQEGSVTGFNLADGNKVVISVSAAGGTRAGSVTVSITNIVLTLAGGVEVTLNPAAVPANLNYTVNHQNASKEDTTTTVSTVAQTPTVELTGGLTIPTITSGDYKYVCIKVAWVNGTSSGVYYPNESGYFGPAAGDSLTPYFVKVAADATAPFQVGTKTYWTWETAFAAAGSGGTVILVDDYDLPTTYEANGMTGAGTYVTGTDGALKYEVKSGQTLLLPYSANDTSIKSGTGSTNDFKHANVSFQDNPDKKIIIENEAAMDPELSVVYTLTVPSGVTLTVNGTNGNPGRVVVGGTILGSEGTNSTIAEGLCYGPHSNLVVDGNLNLGNYSVLSAVGYVLGGGEIKTINADGTNSTGAEIYQPFVIHDWRGGRAAQFGVTTTLSSALATQSGESQVMPFFQWTTMNIHPKLTMTYGNQMIMYASLYDGDAYTSHATLVGPSGLVQLSEGASLTSYYEDIDWGSYSYGFPGRNNVTISGGASLGSFTMTGKLAMGSIDINTANFTLPICYGYSITLVNGTFNLNNPMALLPGSKIEVTSTATLNVNANRFMVFDGLNQGLYHNVSSTGISSPYAENTRSGSQKVKLYPTTRELQGATVNGIAMSADAEFIVDGTLVIGANANFGGVIQTSGTGTIDATAGTAGTTTGAKVQIGVVGNKSIMLQDASIAGMSLHEMNAQIVSAATGERIDVIRGNIYYGSKKETKQEGYSFKYYADAGSVTSVILIGDAVEGDGETATATHDAHPLNETIRGAWCAHSWQDATCTEPKTCTICGATEGEANGHSYTENPMVCDICGKFKFYANVVLGNNLDMMFAFPKSMQTAWTDCYVLAVRTYANGSESTTTRYDINVEDDWGEVTINGVDCYMVTYSGFAAKEMCDTITLTVYDSTGEAISISWTDSIRAYAIRKLNSTENEYLRTVIVDMLNYGAACQNALNYPTESPAAETLATNGLTDEQKGWATSTEPTVEDDYAEVRGEEGTTWAGSQLETTSNIKYYLAFQHIEDGMYASYSYVGHKGYPVSGEKLDFVTVEGKQCIVIQDMVVADARYPITVTVYYADGKVYDTWQDSIEAYAARMTETDAVFAAFMKFADSAYTYLHNK